MNWFDFVIVAILVAGAVIGMRTGIIGAGLTAAGVLVGFFLAGQFSGDVGEIVSAGATGDTWVTVFAYVVIIGASVFVSRIIAKMVRPILTVATLGLSGMVDKLGGVGLGLVLGALISGALILATARLAYDFEVPEEGAAGRVAERIPIETVEDTRETLEDALSDSQFASILVDVADALPFDSFGFIPSDFETSLEVLEELTD